MPRSGTLVICVQNLDFSGANQVVLNVVSGRMHESNVVVLSPKVGTFAARFVESGAAVRIGVLEDLLNEIRDVFCIICNTIMTANIVVEMSQRPHPVIWILHEWWDDEMIKENLRIRNYQGLTLNTVKQALANAAMVVCVCESQRQLYNPSAPSSVIYVGVPDPVPRFTMAWHEEAELNKPFTFLCLGIICPRKNQHWTVEMFKKFAVGKRSVRLQIVGARYTRVYEMDYLEKVKAFAGDDLSIEIYDVTENVEGFYKQADCLILTSLNEVTPMVISEALSWSLPVISTNIAGIKEMYTDGVEGFHFDPGDETRALDAMNKIYSDKVMRLKMGKSARARFEATFDLDLMVETYRKLVVKVAPPVVLLDMDGALIDWDNAFRVKWAHRCPIDRTRSYFMEHCVDPAYYQEAINTFMVKGFFECLEPMPGALDALKEMESDGLKLFICSAPVKGSKFCAQEKIDWVKRHLGEAWLDRLILCQDKTMVAGDLLIDDKPYEYLSPGGKHTTATWKQILFDAPYNRQKRLPRMFRWNDWRGLVYPMLGKVCPVEIYAKSYDEYCELTNGNKPRLDHLLLPPKLTRDTSFSSIHSGMSKEEVQRQHDMLQTSDAPLNPEEIATIVSGSLSLVDGGSSDEDANGHAESTGDHVSSAVTTPSVLSSQLDNIISEKKKVLHDRLRRRNEEYKKVKESSELQERLRADSTEIEGVHVFRTAYNNWKNQAAHGKPTRNNVSPLPAAHSEY
eukprot:gene2521-2761_t